MTAVVQPHMARSRIASAPPVELIPKTAPMLRQALLDLSRVRQQHAASAKAVTAAQAEVPRAQARDTEAAVTAARAGKSLDPPEHAKKAEEHLAECRRASQAQRLALDSVAGDVARAAISELPAVRESLVAELLVLDDSALRMLNDLVGVLQQAAERRAALQFVTVMASRGTAVYAPGTAADAVVGPVRDRVARDRLGDLASAR